MHMNPNKNTMKKLIAMTTLFLPSFIPLFSGDVISLENKEGKRIKAELIKLNGNELTLKKDGGFRHFTIPLDTLAKESQKKVRAEWEPNVSGGAGNDMEKRTEEVFDIDDVLSPKSEKLPEGLRNLDDPWDNIYGMNMGDSYKKCIAIHGLPNKMNYHHKNRFDFTYSGIAFEFKNDNLQSVHILGTSNTTTLLGGIQLGDKKEKIIEKYDVKVDKNRTYIEKGGLSIQFGFINEEEGEILHVIYIRSD